MQPGQEFLGQAPAHPFAEHRDLRVDVDPGLEVPLRPPFPVDSLVAGAHSDDARAVVEQFLPREAGEEIDASGLALLGEPGAEAVEADDVVAVVRHARGSEGRPPRAAGTEEEERVVPHLPFERATARSEIGQEFLEAARIHDRAGEGVISELPSLLDDGDARLSAGRRRGQQLLQVEGAGQPGRAASHHEHVDVQRLPRDLHP
jgi:hypothetical protein